jgi:Ser/Thr protein kinase RdoA (MazF antagonist)
MEEAEAQLIHVSENASFLVTRGDGQRFVLRLSAPGARRPSMVRAELEFMALFSSIARVPVPVAGGGGSIAQPVSFKGEGARVAVLFTFETGDRLGVGGLAPDRMGELGRLAVEAHELTRKLPSTAERPVLTADSLLPPAAPWGDWRRSPAVTPQLEKTLARAEALVKRRLGALDRQPEAFGLIHADLYGNNLLIDGGELVVLDFDDSGYGWHLYDLAASLSYREAGADADELKHAWLDAYLARRNLPKSQRNEIDTLIMLRRLTLLAWIGTHSETALAAEVMPGFAEGTAMLAEGFLTRLG